jgi:hypothetical protein
MAGMATSIVRNTRAFAKLFFFTMTIEVATVITSSDPLHPGSTNREVDWSTLAASHTSIACAWQRLASRERGILGELANSSGGTLVATDYFMIKAADAPASLLDRDSVPAPEVIHRITDVKKDGTTIDGGIFDVQRIIDLGVGSTKLIFIEAKRVQ